ncbi:esterase family protein [Streptomyces sp. RB6PN25]|uniref:Esterase family protein n=1 Tax=Streptomyces humicola TaxID=2953240 RepID=A0ABT1Q575_9ACTN|nr:alpha/beta hydrolase-fold protein [Streptomyces humicola]MCQ4083945.1 esterase family protein [Streptomyces humicola]
MKCLLAAAAALVCPVLVAGCSDEGDPVTFNAPANTARPGPMGGRSSPAQMPTGPDASFTVQRTVDDADSTKIGVTTYHGRKSGFTGRVWVWAPPQYFDPKYATMGFPVLIALPGGLGYPSNYWFGADLRLQEKIYNWSRDGTSLPFIVVMPVLNPDRHYHDCSDIPGQQKMGTWLTQDVPDLVRQNFRTLRARDGWGFMGSSSGGFCALKSVLRYPQTFKAAVASGPDIAPDSPLWHGNEAAMQADDPRHLADQLIRNGGPDVYLGFQVGSTERYDMAKVKRFIAQYGVGPVHTRLQVIDGGRHTARSYTKGMAEGTMQWISEHMRGPSG